jgi:hypothetical protein
MDADELEAFKEDIIDRIIDRMSLKQYNRQAVEQLQVAVAALELGQKRTAETLKFFADSLKTFLAQLERQEELIDNLQNQLIELEAGNK